MYFRNTYTTTDCSILQLESPKRTSKKIDFQKRYFLKTIEDKGPQPYNQIGRMLGYGPSSLNNIRKELLKEGKIQKVIHDGKAAYGITKKGKNSIYDFGILGMTINKILEDGGSYHDNYSHWYDLMEYDFQLPWGIQDDVCYSREISRVLPISKETAGEVQRTLYNCIKEDVKKGKIRLDPTKNGIAILGLMIDYADFVKSINKQSLYYLENMSKEERDFFDKIGDRTLNKEEQSKLDEMRKRTRAKMGVRMK